MNWTTLQGTEQLTTLQQESQQTNIIIFKHSTRCSVSRATLDRLERNWTDSEMKNVKVYLLDLLTYREISNEISKLFEVEHQSPQILIIRNGKSIFNCSHFEIDYNRIKTVLKN